IEGAGENLSFVSNKAPETINDATNWKLAVGRELIVPVMNAGNPFLNEILKQGVSPATIATVLKNPSKQNWGTLLAGKQINPVHIYMSDNEFVKAGVAKFINSTQIPDNCITMGSRSEIITALQKDPYAIGFCNLIDITGADNQSLAENIRLLPIDKNGNGTLDHMEDIYNDMNAFQRGVWIGKYPKALYSNIYAVSKAQPANESELAFLSWVITDGQQYMNASGYCELVNAESQSQLDKINATLIEVPATKNESKTGIVLLILAIIISLSVIVSVIVRHARTKRSKSDATLQPTMTGFDEHSVVVPAGLYFDKAHTWAFMEKDGLVTVGLDDFMQHITGPITRVEMKKAGEKIKKGELLFSLIQSGKQLNIYAPVSGTIRKHNEMLLHDSSILNESPYSEGWVYMIEPANWFKEIQFLDMAEQYKRWLNTEFSRVKDFLATVLKAGNPELSLILLQDGGLLKEGILADFGPEVWDDFQTNFLDNYK
ncbi:MAG: hypothetical protein WCJ95_23095, partial [Mariniphaga sp.]